MPSATNNENANSNSRLQLLNYANVVAYLCNALVVYGYTAVGLPSNAELSVKYQTLITPAPFAFSIWGVIFISELIWTIGQLLPVYRSTELVVKGVGYNYVLACAAQSIWVVLFGLEKITASLLAMISILVPLLVILTKTSDIPTEERNSDNTNTGFNKVRRYWLLKFPFEIHASWIMVATLVNMNVVLVSYNASSAIQTFSGWLSLAIVLIVGMSYTLLKKRKLVVPFVLTWASFAIASELGNPKDSIIAMFSQETIHQVKVASYTVASTLLLVAIVEAIRDYFLKSSASTSEDNDSDNDGGSYTAIDD